MLMISAQGTQDPPKKKSLAISLIAENLKIAALA
jgi:hypothetical protein